ncbi:MAG: A24 family peptidase [Patescibacteria group bacterium]
MFYVAGALIIIFIYDLKHYLIPDKVLFPAIGVALIYRLFLNFSLIPNFLLATVIGSGFFLAIFLVSRGKWMGFGDVKLAILMGFLLGFPNILVALFLSFFFGAIIGVILMALQKKGLKSEIPFGPFLIVGTFLTLFWGSQIIQWYLNFFQI